VADSRARIRSIGALCIATLALLSVGAASASAGSSHSFLSNITGSGDHSLGEPTDVAVDQVSHDIYVTDPEKLRVEKFDSSGNFILMFGKEVDATTGANVCTASSGHTCQPGAPGHAAAEFENPLLLAVDNSGGPSAGDVYVLDHGDGLVQKFDSSGNIVSGWGALGVKNLGTMSGLDVGQTGILYVQLTFSGGVEEFSQSGEHVGLRFASGGSFTRPGFKVDRAANFYTISSVSFEDFRVWVTDKTGNHVVTSTFPTSGFAFDPVSQEIYQDVEEQMYHYGSDCEPDAGACEPVDSFGSGHLSGARGVGVDGSTGAVYVADPATQSVVAFEDIRPIAITEGPTNVTESGVTLNGVADPSTHGEIIGCRFEYGFDTTYGSSVPCSPNASPGTGFNSSTHVTATLSSLSSGTRDHYRLVVTNAAGGTKYGVDRTFSTTAPPAIDGLSSSNLTATTADLDAQVNPNGLDTTYRFEYGTTPSYGQAAPVPDGSLSAGDADQGITVHLTGLAPHFVYHYRLVATNANGTTTSDDHTFNFYPPNCPNSNVRQQTQTNYLPDCRAYELVSPGDAGGTQLYPSGPNTGQATSPSRFAFTGAWSAIPGSGGNPIDNNGDLYVATRTASGWVTRYVGLPANLAAVDGGPPLGPPNSLPGPGADGGLRFHLSNSGTPADKIQANVLTDPGMNVFVDWNDGNGDTPLNPPDTGPNPSIQGSNAPYVWSANGRFLERLPTNLGAVPAGVNPAGLRSLDCTSKVGGAFEAPLLNPCPGDVTASANLDHFVFASEWNIFAADGQLAAPGSVYDNDTGAGTVTVASKAPGGGNIPSEPGDHAGDPLQIPFVSANGSHILMAAGATGPCGLAQCPDPPCTFFTRVDRCPLQPSHLYMRVNGTMTFDVSKGHHVDYVGGTEDGTGIFFTSDEPLTGNDTDTSTDLYRWNEETDSLTLVSAGNNGNGNTDNCNAGFTSRCDVVMYSNSSYCQLSSGAGGNCHSDSFIASKHGDIFFFSPEVLDGTRGIPNKENLYDFRDGQIQYVSTLTTGPFCFKSPNEGISDDACSDTPLTRMEVTPDGIHMAFITTSAVTQYDNAGHLEMYLYDAVNQRLTCVSCIPSGESPITNVAASQNGLFISDDGRPVFTTEDALVHGDTNKGQDVYEYVDGRPQLVTTGTGETRTPGGFFAGIQNAPGLQGISADGTDIYFSTLSSLVPEDHNGLFLKFYDARTGGGFSNTGPPAPCEAADECHGPGSPPAAPIKEGTGVAIGGGNVAPGAEGKKKKKAHKRKPHRKRHRRHAATKAHGGSR
jgi:hypothetical protein